MKGLQKYDRRRCSSGRPLIFSIWSGLQLLFSFYFFLGHDPRELVSARLASFVLGFSHFFVLPTGPRPIVPFGTSLAPALFFHSCRLLCRVHRNGGTARLPLPFSPCSHGCKPSLAASRLRSLSPLTLLVRSHS